MNLAKEWIVVDLDGTLCDCDHRIHHAQNSNWDEFHENLGKDKPNWPVMWLLEALEPKADKPSDGKESKFLVVTGRPERYRKLTIEWLVKYKFFPHELMMRGDHDFDKDYEVKIALLETHFGSKEKVLSSVWFCLDDRDQVCENLRNYGLPVWQVKQGDY